jgi:hypothetical protein
MTTMDWLAVAIGLIWAVLCKTEAAPLWSALLITGVMGALPSFQHSRWIRCGSLRNARGKRH